jgi:hypothetical protein
MRNSILLFYFLLTFTFMILKENVDQNQDIVSTGLEKYRFL